MQRRLLVPVRRGSHDLTDGIGGDDSRDVQPVRQTHCGGGFANAGGTCDEQQTRRSRGHGLCGALGQPDALSHGGCLPWARHEVCSRSAP